MLFLKIKIILSAKQQFALEYERVSTHILKQPSGLYCGKRTVVSSSTPSCLRETWSGKSLYASWASPRTRPYNDKSLCLLRHTSLRRKARKGLHSFLHIHTLFLAEDIQVG